MQSGVDLNPSEPTKSIAERLDCLPLTKLHVVVLIFCTLGFSSDIAEIALSNALVAVFLAPPYLVPQSQLSWLLAALFVGGALGAPVFGWLGDRLGRKIVLQLALVILAGSSCAAAMSPDIRSMTLCRFISGLALGAYPPLTAAYLAELLPPRQRGLLIMISTAVAFVGAPAAIFMLRGLYLLLPLGTEAWRWAVASGGVLAAVTVVLLRTVPDSPRWLASTKRQTAAEKACQRFEISAGVTSIPSPILIKSYGMPQETPLYAIFKKNSVERTHLLILCIIYALAPWATIGFGLISVAILVAHGFRVNDSLLFAGATMAGPPIGIFVAAFIIDIVERRVTLIACATTMVFLGSAFVAANTLVTLMLCGFFFNLTSAVFGAALHVYATELFATDLRARATSAAWGTGRAASAFVPILLLAVLADYGPTATMAVVVTALLGCLVILIAVCPPGLARKPIS